MIPEIINFFVVNWQNILITLVGGAIFYFLSKEGLKKYISSAEKERIKQAKITLLDILEARIINKQEISLHKINNLMNAISREHSIDLFDITTPQSLLQDLELIFEKSHHLDSVQKDNYCKQIQDQIEIIEKTAKIDIISDKSQADVHISNEYIKLLEEISTKIELNDSANAQKTLNLLENRIVSDMSRGTRKIQRPETFESTVSFISILVSIVGALVTSAFLTNGLSNTGFILSTGLIIMFGLAVVIIAIYYFYIRQRIEKED